MTLNNVDTSQAGTYQVHYNVTDLDGNPAQQVTRTVIVTPDVTAPVITINGNNPENHRVGTTYTDANATAADYFQINLNNQIQYGNNMDENILGQYHFWYTVEDASGNRDSAVRVVNVIDDVAPQISLLGGDTLHIEVGSFINDPGYTATDNYYQSFTTITDSGLVNTRVVGLYQLTYTATDGSGNIGTAQRWVSVEDNTAPLVTLIGKDTIVVDVFNNYSEQGVLLRDNYCTPSIWSVDQQPNTSVLGDYVLTYTSTDCFGNTSVGVQRVVRVVDRQAPQISLNGFAALTMYRWETFDDPGVSMTDNYYGLSILEDSLKITSNFNPDWPGLYGICYQVTDPSGNKSAQVCRTIEVLESITSVNPDNGLGLKAYPNPGNGILNIRFDQALQEKALIRVFDMSGKEVYNTQWNAGIQTGILNLDIASGLYQVRIESGQMGHLIKLQVIR